MSCEIFSLNGRYSPAVRQQAAVTFLRTLSAENRVDFFFDRVPCTDGKSVWLGQSILPSPSFETCTLGHGIHEMMHVAHTDFSKVRGLEPLTHRLLNILEDVRIESIGERTYPGYRLWRERLAVFFESTGGAWTGLLGRDESCLERLLGWLHCELLARMGFEPALRLLSSARNRCGSMSARGRREFLKKGLAALTARSTAECLELACAMRKLLVSECRAEMQKRAEADNAGVKQQNLSLETEPAGAAAREGFFVQLFVEAKKIHEQKVREYAKARKAWESQQAELARQTSENGEKPRDAYRAGLWPEDDEKKSGMLHEEFKAQYARVRKGLPQLTKRFLRLFMTRDACSGLTHAREGAELRDDWIDAMARTDARLFEKAFAGRSVSAEVCVLLDRSGSMGVATMTLAKAAVNALVAALARVKGTRSRVALFPGLNDDDVAVAKEVRDSLHAFERKLPLIDAFGSTPIQESMLWAIDSFAHSRARNKLLVVITDGRFNPKLAASLNEKMKGRGIEAALLSIGIDNKAAVENHVLVKEAGALNRGLLQLIAQTAFAQALRG